MARSFPDWFVWGASTAAYQIEGAVAEDGRGPSIWDNFCQIPGRIDGGDTGAVACDHYHRYREDIGLMQRLGLGAYRFSVSWSRVLPFGRGRPNQPGLDFYDRLVDGLAEAGIQPWVCLYHWDLPQALQDKGGWPNRDLAGWFGDYAELMVQRLGDRVRHWATFNEPNVAAFKGYGDGEHAPGIADRSAALRALHTINLAHGRAIQALRSWDGSLVLGCIGNLNPTAPATDSAADLDAATMLDALWNKAFPDAQFLGRYPEPIAAAMKPLIQEGDMALITQEVDYFAYNHYSRFYARHDPSRPFGFADAPPPPGRKTTAMGWEVTPAAFLETLKEVPARYGNYPVYVMENGAAFEDVVEPGGRIRDADRIAYLQGYLNAVLDAVEAGVDVRGYFVWSLLDNFEWALGYSKRFGLIHVDYADLKRTPKDSFDYYAGLARGGKLQAVE
jgi:beta-glucosidase